MGSSTKLDPTPADEEGRLLLRPQRLPRESCGEDPLEELVFGLVGLIDEGDDIRLCELTSPGMFLTAGAKDLPRSCDDPGVDLAVDIDPVRVNEGDDVEAIFSNKMSCSTASLRMRLITCRSRDTGH